MADYNLVTDNPEIDGLRSVYLSLCAYHRLAGLCCSEPWADRRHLQTCWVLQQRQAARLPPKSETALPLTFHWPTQVTWPHPTSKGQVCATFLYQRTGLFQDSTQGHFQSPFAMHKHLFEDAERKCMPLSHILLLQYAICFLPSFCLLFLVRYFPGGWQWLKSWPCVEIHGEQNDPGEKGGWVHNSIRLLVR